MYTYPNLPHRIQRLAPRLHPNYPIHQPHPTQPPNPQKYSHEHIIHTNHPNHIKLPRLRMVDVPGHVAARAGRGEGRRHADQKHAVDFLGLGGQVDALPGRVFHERVGRGEGVAWADETRRRCGEGGPEEEGPGGEAGERAEEGGAEHFFSCGWWWLVEVDWVVVVVGGWPVSQLMKLTRPS